MPETNFMQEREVTVDSYSESVSSNDKSSDDRTITADSDSSAAQSFKDAPCILETDSKEIEATLNQIGFRITKCCRGIFNTSLPYIKISTL